MITYVSDTTVEFKVDLGAAQSKKSVHGIGEQRTSLAKLPKPSPALFGDQYPWMPVSSAQLADALSLDRGLLGTWRLRGIGPKAVNPTWLKGRANAYRISAVLTWLADRRGERLDEIKFWTESLADLGVEGLDDNRVLHAAQKMAEVEGPRSTGLRWAPGGWRRYVTSLIFAE